MATGLDLSGELLTQLSWHWDSQARPRLAGLTDEEYRWEPVPGCWTVRPRGTGHFLEIGRGGWVIDYAFPAPDPPPVTTIAWRLIHVVVGVLGQRNARYFGGPPCEWDDYACPATAADALAELDDGYAIWSNGVRRLDADALAEQCGEPGHDSSTMLALVLHIHRELIHHLAEVALLRDLWQARAVIPVSPGAARGSDTP